MFSSIFVAAMWMIIAIPSVVIASTTNYNVYNYDMAPTFTPDGRLLQVEYASVASESSAPILAIQVDDDTLILMTIKNSNSPQNRIVILPIWGEDGKRQSRQQIQGRVCIAMSGVLADSLCLIQVGLKEASEQYRKYRSPMTTLQVATAMADACQRHSFGGGIRPFGCTLLTCGFSSPSSTTNGGILSMYQTDPSGAMIDASTSSDTPPTTSPYVRWIVGGSTTIQRKVRKRLDTTLSKWNKESSSSSSISTLIASVGKAFLKETQKLQTDGGSGGSDTTTRRYTTLEVVVMNRKLGCYRLSNKEIGPLLK